jgi:hypothetical protein
VSRIALFAVIVAAAASATLDGAPAGGESSPRRLAAVRGLLLGVTGNTARFKGQTGQDSLVDQAFLGWGQGQTFGAPFAVLLPTLAPIPMLHLGTNRYGREAITPGAIAAGQGDAYLIALNRAIGIWGKGVYVRPMAEMNNSANFWSAYEATGQPKDAAHSTAAYRHAFARIFLILHGGSASAIDAKLKQLGLAPLAGAADLLLNPFPRLRIVWSPLAGGNPVPGNAPAMYYPGAKFVDVEGGDIYDEQLTDTAPWQSLEALSKLARGHGKPFSVPEWGLSAIDDPTFVKHMCTFLSTHGTTEMAMFYESRPGSSFDLESKTKSQAMYRRCVTPLAGALPSWAGGNVAGFGVSIGALSLTPNPGLGVAPLDVRFSIVARLSAPIVHWLLVFGDGSQTEGSGRPPVTAQHSYTGDGIYQPTLIVFQAPPFTPDAALFVASAGVIVGTGAEARVNFVPSVTAGPPPVAVSFRTELNPPAKSSNWQLVYGDGNTRQGTGTPPHFMGHTYGNKGTFHAHLIVGGPVGRRYLASVDVTVGGRASPPAAGAPRGTVLVNGKPFAGGQIPYKSKIDVTGGTLLLETDTGSVQVFGDNVPAIFTLLRGTDNKKPVVEFRLIKGNFGACKRKTSSAATAAAVKPVRQLWGNGKGSFRTRGRYSSATVRGTFWLTADRCDGTLTQVKRGVVQVSDFPLNRLFTVRARQSHLAKP